MRTKFSSLILPIYTFNSILPRLHSIFPARYRFSLDRSSLIEREEERRRMDERDSTPRNVRNIRDASAPSRATSSGSFDVRQPCPSVARARETFGSASNRYRRPDSGARRMCGERAVSAIQFPPHTSPSSPSKGQMERPRRRRRRRKYRPPTRHRNLARSLAFDIEIIICSDALLGAGRAILRLL